MFPIGKGSTPAVDGKTGARFGYSARTSARGTGFASSPVPVVPELARVMHDAKPDERRAVR